MPSPSSLRDATSPKGRGFGKEDELYAMPRALPSGELSSAARLRGPPVQSVSSPVVSWPTTGAVSALWAAATPLLWE